MAASASVTIQSLLAGCSPRTYMIRVGVRTNADAAPPASKPAYWWSKNLSKLTPKFPTRLILPENLQHFCAVFNGLDILEHPQNLALRADHESGPQYRSEEHTSELQSPLHP